MIDFADNNAKTISKYLQELLGIQTPPTPKPERTLEERIADLERQVNNLNVPPDDGHIYAGRR